MSSDLQLVTAAIAAICLSIWLIVKLKLHPFLGLLCGAFVLGLITGTNPQTTAAAIQKGFGDVLGGSGIVVSLGLILGAILQFSGAASVLANAALRVVGRAYAPWGSLVAAMVIGLPLFFETGVVLLLPIVGAAAARLASDREGGNPTVALIFPALAGLSVLHALLPPHPGPLLAAHELGANVGRTMLYGFVVAIPTAIIAGPLLARYIARVVNVESFALPNVSSSRSPPLPIALLVALLPVLLIALNAMQQIVPPSVGTYLGWIAPLGTPVLALLIANIVGLALLFRGQMQDDAIMGKIWNDAFSPAGTLLLSIGAGGALKQVLVTVGMADTMSRFARTGLVSPLIMAWAVAVLIRLATGSATVATITAAGLMSGVVANSASSTNSVAPEWIVLAIGAGSVFFSHVNDPGFWLVKSYLGISTADTLKSWSVMETVISVVGLLAVLCASRIL